MADRREGSSSSSSSSSDNLRPLGAIVTADGDTIIPASRRPDGTYRKEIKVKKGYVPPDEVAKYETRAQRHNRDMRDRYPAGYVPGAPVASASASSSSNGGKANLGFPQRAPQKSEPKPLTKAQKKNLNRKAKRKEKDSDEAELDEDFAELNLSTGKNKNKDKTKSGHTESKSSEDPAKKMKNIKKKLRQIEDLEEKIEKEGFEPSEDQKAKINRKTELLEELAALEEGV